MAKRSGVHTVPNADGTGWVNKLDGEVVSRHQRKDAAVDRGRGIARREGTEHTIHRKDGRIGEKNSYGNDPFPPRDKR